MKANVEAMRAVTYLTAACIDRSRHHPDEGRQAHFEELVALLTPVAKAWPTDLGVEMTSLGVQIHGGMGYVEETGAAQFFRDARIAPIYEGTNGIQAIDLVLRKLPLRGGAVVGEFLEEMRLLDKDLAEAGGELAGIRDELAAGLAALTEVTDWMMGREDPNDALAGASPYLRMFGTVVGGWLLARQALAAHRQVRDGNGFRLGKIETARFYCTQLLPQAAGLMKAVTAGARPLYSIDDSAL